MPFQRALPLYGEVGFVNRDNALTFDAVNATPHVQTNNPHPGLIFDKFIDAWSITPDGVCEYQDPQPKAQAGSTARRGSKRVFYDEQVQKNLMYLDTGLKAVLLRQKALVATLGGKDIEMATDWRFVSGLGNGHPFETGFIWHRTLGVPYLPGSAVKGLIRAWAERWGGLADAREVVRLFGPRDEEARSNPATGSLILFDALPVGVPKLEVDIMNPHYAKYYAEDKDANDRAIPPADYLSPTPIFFLAVAANQTFRFVLAPRCQKEANSENDVVLGFELLKEALSTLGAGGKTAVGYGHFRFDEGPPGCP